MALSDREKWILGVAGSLATLGLGYLIWRHENAVSQSEAAANNATQNADNAAYAQQLEASLAVGGGSTDGTANDPLGGGGYVGSTLGGGNGATIEPTGGSGGDSNLAAILAAFFPQGTNGTNGNGSTNNPGGAQPGEPPVATPQPVVPPVTGFGPTGPNPITVTGGPVPYQPPIADPEEPIDGPILFSPGGSVPVANPVHVVSSPIRTSLVDAQ